MNYFIFNLGLVAINLWLAFVTWRTSESNSDEARDLHNKRVSLLLLEQKLAREAGYIKTQTQVLNELDEAVRRHFEFATREAKTMLSDAHKTAQEHIEHARKVSPIK